MTFDSVVLPPDCVNGVRIELMDGNDISVSGSGADTAKQKWPWPRRRFTLPFENMYRRDTNIGGYNYTGFQTFADFMVLRGSTARAFAIWDPSHLFRKNQNLGSGDGGTTVFQLSYTLSDSANSVPARAIQHPVPTGTAIPLQYQGDDTGDPATASTQTSCSISLGAVKKIHMTATGGTFKIGSGGNWTPAINFNETAANIQNSIKTYLAGVTTVCSGGPMPGTDLIIALVTPTGNQPTILALDVAALTGGTATLSEVTAGSGPLTENTHYTVNVLNGQITFAVAPAASQVVFLNHVWFYTVVRFFQYLDMTLDSIYAKFAAVLIEVIVEDWH